jgi:hypothetical protein
MDDAYLNADDADLLKQKRGLKADFIYSFLKIRF